MLFLQQETLLVFQKIGPQELGSFDGLLVLPFADEFGIAAEKNVRNSPSVEFCGAGVDRRGDEAVLDAVSEC